MTDSTGKTGRGVTLELTNGESPTDFVAIANVTTINFTGRDAEEIDFTHLSSLGGFREFRQGFKDGGTINFDYHFTPTETSHVELLSSWLNGETVEWRINYSGAGWNYVERGTGYIQNPGDISIDVGNPIGGSGTLRVSGGSTIEAV